MPTQRDTLALLLAAALVAASACSGTQEQIIRPDESCFEFEEEAGTFVEITDPGAYLVEGVESFEVDGLPVILKHTPGKPVLSVALYVRGGVTNLTPETQGIETLTLDVLVGGGSTALQRQALSAELNRMGTRFGAVAGQSYSYIGMQAITRNWDRSFEIFSDVVLDPAFPEEELELQRTYQLDFLDRLEERAGRYLSKIATDLLFEDHPYALRQWGTAEAVASFTVDDLRAHHRELLDKSRLLFVAVGDISRDDLEAKLKGTLAGLPDKGYQAPELPPFQELPPQYAEYDVPNIATNYLRAYFAAPAPTHPDYYAMVAATAILSNRSFEKIRTKLNLSYAVFSGISAMPVNYGSIYLSSADPMRTLAQMYDEIESMQDWLVGERELSDQVEVFLTSYYLDLQTLGAQRDLLANAHIIWGDWRKSAALISNLRAVTPEDVRRVMQTYFRDLQVGYYGDMRRFDERIALSQPWEADRAALEHARELEAELEAERQEDPEGEEAPLSEEEQP